MHIMPPCYDDFKQGLNLEGPWPAGPDICAHRYMTLTEAQAACGAEPQCDGVTMDGGVECAIEHSKYATSYPDGLKWKFPYSCRSKPTKQWGAHNNLGTWMKKKGTQCPLRPETAVPACPVRAVAAVHAHAPKVDAGDEEHHPRVLARTAELERISALEASAVDVDEVARGTCPSAVSSGGGGGAPPLPIDCSGRASLLEQLATLATLPGGDSDACEAARANNCMLTHNGRPDGWGGQHFRRVRMLLAAVQLGCSYLHVPLFPMNENSRQHGISHQVGEKFFGLSHYCSDSKRQGAPIHCLDAFGNAPVDVQPLHVTHALSAVCNTTTGGLLRAWRRQVHGRHVICEEATRVPPFSRCATLRATAALRRRYYVAHGGAPALPWYAPPAAAVAGSAGSALGALRVQIAVHVRRGDLHDRALARWISNAMLSRALSDLVNALTEVRAQWASGGDNKATDGAPARPPLDINLHVMTQTDWSKSEKLPRRAWHALCASANLSFTTHVDSDPLLTMHHLIGADVLLKSNSGYSDVAAAYSAGVRLFFVPSRELAISAVGPLEPTATNPPSSNAREWGFGLRDANARQAFVCALLAHLRYRAAHADAPPPQALRHAGPLPAVEHSTTLKPAHKDKEHAYATSQMPSSSRREKPGLPFKVG